ncbi:hypothetical protein [Paenibacillus contaminans]|uniref:Aldolase n=1 Tax=Paenibacillus contaminans TaxID=450362 RepID=A0A329M814_9BACL|nr:hypothetical protein [Paenibacillus contaminans]RAV16094.1 hypothetical protein DQG23_29315 [Paenibacillus contaminans]
MHILKTEIGEHTAIVRTESEAIVAALNQMFEKCRADAESVLTADLVVDAELGYGEPSPDYAVTITTEGSTIIYNRLDYRIETDASYRTANIVAYNELSLKHAFMNLYCAYIVHIGWGLMIHSSCVIEDGQAYLFAGQSGAGKSTVAKLSAPRPLLSDEASLVKITPDGILVYDSPFRSELMSMYEGRICRLGGIHLLIQSSQVERKQIRSSEGIMHLLDKVFFWAHDAKETSKVLGMLREMVVTVPVYELHFQKNNTFWEKIS